MQIEAIIFPILIPIKKSKEIKKRDEKDEKYRKKKG
jgi:hypothetical protein